MNKIYVATHKPFTPPTDSLYIPIQVGAAGKAPLGYLTDDSGINISNKNHLYGELTGLYWIWKNETETDHVGLCHYRRYFLNSKHQLLTEEDCEQIFNNYDIILPYKTICPGMNYYEMFAASHNIKDLETIESIIAQSKPEYLADYKQAIHSETYYMGNLFITSKKLFDEYIQWLFEIFEDAEKTIDVSSYDAYHARVYGFLSEQMLMAWVNHHHLRVCELEVAITSEKAETTEMLSTLADYLTTEDVSGAISYYTSFLKQRPDIRFQASDIYGNLPFIELALDIWGSESSFNLRSIANYHSDIHALIAFVRKSYDCIANGLSENNPSHLHWLIDRKVTWVMMERILEHINKEPSILIRNLNQLAMLFHALSHDLECLQLVQFALTLDPENSTSVRHALSVCGQANGPRKPMNVAIATNRKYVPVSLVTLYSLFYNNPESAIHVYILNCELTDEDAESFAQLAHAWNQKISLLSITDMSLFDGLPTTDAWSREAYFRLLMPNMLPSEIDRILYLDVDTIVNKSIREFYDTDFADMDFVVCEDIMLNRVYKKYYHEHFEETTGKEFTYFNSGVMLWNLPQIRQNYTFDIYRQKLLKYLPVLQCMDQDILNVVHCQKTLTADWRKYNLLIPTAIQNQFTCEDVRNVSHIIHYLGPKPWNPDVEFHELYQIWKDYEQLYLNDDLDVDSAQP